MDLLSPQSPPSSPGFLVRLVELPREPAGAVLRIEGRPPGAHEVQVVHVEVGEEATEASSRWLVGMLESQIEDASPCHLPECLRRADILRYARRVGHDPRFYLTTVADVARFWRGLGAVGRAVEMAPRLGEFTRSREAGETLTTAALRGREISTDFAVRGDGGLAKTLQHSSMFFSAMMASADRLYRGVARDKGHRLTTATRIGMVSMVGAGLWALNKSIAPDELDRLEEWDRWANFHFFVPRELMGLEGQGPDGSNFVHLRMPRMFEVGAIASLTERTLDSMAGSDNAQDRLLAADVGRIVLDQFGVSIPTPLDIFAEQMFNRNLFTGRPIEPLHQVTGTGALPPGARGRAGGPRVLQRIGGASERLSRGVAETLGVSPARSPVPQISPARAEAFLRGIFSEFATMGLYMADVALYPGGPTKNLDELPGVGSFLASPTRNRYTTEFYDNWSAMNQLYNLTRDAANREDVALVDELIETPEVLLRDRMNRVQRAASAINAEIRSAQKDPYTTGDEKRDLIRQLTLERNQMLEEVVKENRQLRRELQESSQ